MKPAPDDAYVFEFCDTCIVALENDDYSGMDDEQEKATRIGLAHVGQSFDLFYDGAEFGFSTSRCDCCEGLAGDRFRVFGFKRGE